ncbi:MAG: TlyA family RNA methyltransferase [Ruminococcus sp.]|nr:TlyA family RNA methyltransferase [Ruminococcus sp.]
MAERLDKYLVSHGFAKSRERAKQLIQNGEVCINGIPAAKASDEVGENDTVTAGEDLKYVGRGALKLLKAVEVFGLELGGLVCADLGASTGGFTQVMLEQGASKVYAVDVGHGQLDERLASDSRVVNMEGVNVRELTLSDFEEPPQFISADLSFISLRAVAPVIAELTSDNGSAAVLIKPQFEAGRAALGKNGIVKDPKDHIRVITELDAAFRLEGLYINKLTWSPVKGGSGNTEYLALLTKQPPAALPDIQQTVREAFSNLRK